MAFIKDNKIAIIIALLFLVAGTLAYFQISPRAINVMNVWNDIRFKTELTDGNLDVFALANNNALAKIPTQGQALPEPGALILGHEQARMMLAEQEFENIGNSIAEFDNINMTVGGILKKTGTPLDDMHFVSHEDFVKIEADEGKLYLKKKDNMPKFFYNLPVDERITLNNTFTSGGLEGYTVMYVNGKEILPLIIGSEEAQMMQEEKLFEKPGDIITGFFGKDVKIAGVLAPTGTMIDMIHFIPAEETALN